MEIARGTAAGCTATDLIVSSLSKTAAYESHGSPSISIAPQGDICTFDEYWRMRGSNSNERDELQTVGRILDKVLGDDGRLRQKQEGIAEENQGSRDSSGNTCSEQRPLKIQQTLSSWGMYNVFTKSF